jgi:hypothetical protein
MYKRSGYDGVTIIYINRIIYNTQFGIKIFVIYIKLTLTIKIKYLFTVVNVESTVCACYIIMCPLLNKKTYREPGPIEG